MKSQESLGDCHRRGADKRMTEGSELWGGVLAREGPGGKAGETQQGSAAWPAVVLMPPSQFDHVVMGDGDTRGSWVKVDGDSLCYLCN